MELRVTAIDKHETETMHDAGLVREWSIHVVMHVDGEDSPLEILGDLSTRDPDLAAMFRLGGKWRFEPGQLRP